MSHKNMKPYIWWGYKYVVVSLILMKNKGRWRWHFRAFGLFHGIVSAGVVAFDCSALTSIYWRTSRTVCTCPWTPCEPRWYLLPSGTFHQPSTCHRSIWSCSENLHTSSSDLRWPFQYRSPKCRQATVATRVTLQNSDPSSHRGKSSSGLSLMNIAGGFLVHS